MEQTRRMAIQEFSQHQAIRLSKEDKPISQFFGTNVFDLEKMRNYVPKETFEQFVQSMEKGEQLDKSISYQIAEGMKNWAMSLGATHYTHWFHPLTDATAEKHESFVEPTGHGTVIECFKGDALVQQEPDASSFPSGGLRNTFEARGYTAWDPTSPAFVIDQTLCIPTIFVSYTGEALDLKTPLLRSLHAIDTSAIELAKLFEPETRKVDVMLGIEQEYFAIDLAFYRSRPDLMMCNRTLQGHNAAKDQQLDDHYFGNIPSRIMAFMKDFETEAYKLGVVLKTRHNEVAPNQFEFAPLYAQANLAIDQNQMMMLLMRKVAKRHNLRVIFHEKPFAGVNGSGKHCNWSLVTNNGVNLLSPGKSPATNLRFLSFFAATMRAVYEHHYLLMASVASLSNANRLGGSEAPPSVLSLFMGSQLSQIFNNIANGDDDTLDNNTLDKAVSIAHSTMRMVEQLPEIAIDDTDRNRTSPFAFTGNRFEFRAVGASANCATSIIPLNAAVAQQFIRFKRLVDEKLAGGVVKEKAVLEVIRQFVIESKDICFEGDGYSKSWQEEAKRRGLEGIDNVTEAFKAYIRPKTIELMEQLGILSKRELYARYEVKNEAFLKKLQIEARVLGDMMVNHIIPTAVRYQNILIDNVRGLRDLFPEEYKKMAASNLSAIRKISEFVELIHKRTAEMIEARRMANQIPDFVVRAQEYNRTVLPYLDEIRNYADELEMIVDDELWPLTKYREIMFLR